MQLPETRTRTHTPHTTHKTRAHAQVTPIQERPNCGTASYTSSGSTNRIADGHPTPQAALISLLITLCAHRSVKPFSSSLLSFAPSSHELVTSVCTSKSYIILYVPGTYVTGIRYYNYVTGAQRTLRPAPDHFPRDSRYLVTSNVDIGFTVQLLLFT